MFSTIKFVHRRLTRQTLKMVPMMMGPTKPRAMSSTEGVFAMAVAKGPEAKARGYIGI